MIAESTIKTQKETVFFRKSDIVYFDAKNKSGFVFIQINTNLVYQTP
jgi:hypothetical protein